MANGDVYKVEVQSCTRSGEEQKPVLTLAGTFMFDGRLKSAQAGDFTYISNPASNPDSKPAFNVIVNRGGNVIRRNMKACDQRNIIEVRLKALLDKHISEIPPGHIYAKPSDVVDQDFVDTLEAVGLNVITEVPPPSAQTDPLEIPDFLKRT